jgi:hypothetical protein
MSRSVLLKVVLVTALGGLALIGRDVGAFSVWITPGLVAFGIVNAVLAPRGTTAIRVVAIAGALAALLWPPLQPLVVLLAWLVWPPAFLVAWALSRDTDDSLDAEQPERSAAATRARVTIAAIIGAVAIASLAYRLIVAHSLQQTAALFIGIPALLAIVVVFSVSPRSAIGVACKAVTVGMLVSLIFLGEGMVCIAMSAPLFYAIAVAIGVAVDRTWRHVDKAPTTFACLAILAIVPMSLEGVSDATSFSRDEWVSETRVVHASPRAIERALFEPPRFDRVLPLYLRAGFPRPISTRLERSTAGTRMVIRFRGGEMRLDGVEPRTGDLILDLEEMRPGSVRWRAVSDDSHMTHFLAWREARVQWETAGADSTKVTWTLRYRRGLDPAWYFGPWERYATHLAAGYLIDSVATP